MVNCCAGTLALPGILAGMLFADAIKSNQIKSNHPHPQCSLQFSLNSPYPTSCIAQLHLTSAVIQDQYMG